MFSDDSGLVRLVSGVSGVCVFVSVRACGARGFGRVELGRGVRVWL